MTLRTKDDKDIFTTEGHFRVDRRCKTMLAIDYDNDGYEYVPVRRICDPKNKN